MPKIYFAGDPHGRLDYLFDLVDRERPDALIMLGDLEPQESFFDDWALLEEMTDLWFIHGNHDTDRAEYLDRLADPRVADKNLHGRIAKIAGLRIAGLGGVFRGKVWMPRTGDEAPDYKSEDDYLRRCGNGNHWRGGLPLKHRSTIFPSQIEALAFRQQADILVTHEAATCHVHGFAAIDRLAQRLGVQRHFHGHHHTPVDYGDTRGRLGFQSHLVEFRDVIDQDGQRVLNAVSENADG